jgi:hypothetical protein
MQKDFIVNAGNVNEDMIVIRIKQLVVEDVIYML